MSLSAPEIARVTAELKALEGAPIQRTWAPEPRTAVLRLRAPGHTHHLLVSAEPDLTRLHLVERRPAGAPAPFQEALRAEVEGLRIASVDAVPGDRVVRLELEGPDRRRTLVAELTGRHGNLFVLDEAGTVLHSAVPNLSKRRDNVRGRPYEPPRPRPNPPEEVDRFAEAVGEGAFPVNRAVAAQYQPLARETGLESRRREVRRPVARALDRLARTRKKVAADAEKARDPERWQRLGELLKTELHRAKKGMHEIEVTDWYAPDTPKVRVPLAPELSPQENLARLFARHRKGVAAKTKVAERQAQLDREEARLAQLLEAVDAAEDAEALEQAAVRARRAGLAPPAPARKREAAERAPFRRFKSATGHDILVGRGAKDNHRLTFQVARGNDVWMHVRDWQGSHVVVPTGGRGEVDEGTLLDAAHLAAHFSKARGEAIVEVTWTQRKHVRHPKGAAPGLVTYAAAHTLSLRVEPERIARVMAAEEPAVLSG